MQKILDAIRWKARQKYSQLRCHLGGGYYIWQLEDGIQFISRPNDAFSHVLYVCKGHEQLEMRWCRRWIEAGNAGQTLIDCGANIGYFSAVLAQACSIKEIVAVEGNNHTAELCKQNLDILEIKNARVVKAVLSASSSEKCIIPDKPGKEPWQQAVRTNSISDNSYTTTLDNLVSDFKIHPNLVKIDCEGFETFILKGSNYLLSYLRPAFMIECNDRALTSVGTNRYELFGLLRRFNYKLFHLASFTGVYPFGAEVDDDFPASEFNFAAIPNDNKNLDRWNNSVHLINS